MYYLVSCHLVHVLHVMNESYCQIVLSVCTYALYIYVYMLYYTYVMLFIVLCYFVTARHISSTELPSIFMANKFNSIQKSRHRISPFCQRQPNVGLVLCAIWVYVTSIFIFYVSFMINSGNKIMD